MKPTRRTVSLPLWTVGLLLLAGCFAAQHSWPPPEEPEPARPSAAQTLPLEAPAAERWIFVQKSERTLKLYEGTRLLRTYPIVLGKEPSGPKLYEGDQRTPEGVYHIARKYVHPLWDRFMWLDYPTPMNQEIYSWSLENGLIPVRGRGVPGIGGAIGIHGTEDENLNRADVNWTAGCISLLNHDVEELYDAVPVGTRVLIEP